MKAFYNHRKNGVHLKFPNGNSISTIWGSDSYTENSRLFPKISTSEKVDGGSNDVEVLFTCSEKLCKKIEKKYNDSDPQPIGHLTIDKWLKIINLLAK